MARRVARLTIDTLADLPASVRTCLFWELDPVERARIEGAAEAESEKEAWLSRVLLEWGSCGRVVYADDEPAGFVIYAPPHYFPGSASLPTAPMSEDAVQMATAEVFEGFTGGGVGRLLMQSMVKDLLKRGDVRAVECIGLRGLDGGIRPDGCVLPVEFLQRVGFKTYRPHPRHPRMRMDLRSVLTWRTEVEEALERLIGVVRPAALAGGRPAAAHRDAPL